MFYKPEKSQCEKCKHGDKQCKNFKRDEDAKILHVFQLKKICEPILFVNCLAFEHEN